MNLPWVLMHSTEETSRHAGHADILREMATARLVVAPSLSQNAGSGTRRTPAWERRRTTYVPRADHYFDRWARPMRPPFVADRHTPVGDRRGERGGSRAAGRQQQVEWRRAASEPPSPAANDSNRLPSGFAVGRPTGVP